MMMMHYYCTTASPTGSDIVPTFLSGFFFYCRACIELGVFRLYGSSYCPISLEMMMVRRPQHPRRADMGRVEANLEIQLWRGSKLNLLPLPATSRYQYYYWTVES